MFSKIVDKSTNDHYYFVTHKDDHQFYLKLRSVCRLWNDIVLMMLPQRRHLRLSPHNDAEFEQRMPYIANNTDISLYFKSHLTFFCANKCTSRKLLLVADLFSNNITKLFVEEFPSPDVNVPILLSKLTNLKQIHIARAHWSTKFRFDSASLQTITLQSCLGMKTMKFACPSLQLFVFDRGILEIPFLEDIGERKLRFVIQSKQHVDVVVKGLNLNNLKLHCTTKSTYVKISKCLGVSFKFASRSTVDINLRKCFYSTVLIEGEKVESLELSDMKMKALKLRCARLQTFNTTNCVIKFPDYCCPKLFQSPAIGK